jgi:hypothetical protein
MKKKAIFGISLTGALATISAPVHAHCPLCTAGAAAGAGAAALLGVTYGAIGIFLGAFATALGLWMARIIKKKIIPGQYIVVFWAVYLSTLLPLVPLMKDYSPLYIAWSGDYGSLLHRTYLINWFIVGAAIGTLIVWITPRLSALITKWRGGKTIRFQGLALTLLLLTAAGVLMQVLR